MVIILPFSMTAHEDCLGCPHQAELDQIKLKKQVSGRTGRGGREASKISLP